MHLEIFNKKYFYFSVLFIKIWTIFKFCIFGLHLEVIDVRIITLSFIKYGGKMNGFYNGFDHVVIETPEERESKRKKQRKLFSRVFLALFLFVILSQVLAEGVYFVASYILSEEQYLAFAKSPVWAIIISCVIQYVIAFPVFLLALLKTDKSEKREVSRLSGKDFVLLLCIGEALMFIGNLIGTLLNQTIGSLIGKLPENDISTIISETPAWLIFICAVVIAPIVEELIFRKLIIDRLSIYGDHIAILFSAVAFGLMHGNLYQFFYATFLGVLLGYVYTKTRNVKYTIYMHMIINFLGSIVALPVEKAMNEFYRLYEIALSGEAFDILSLTFNGLIMLAYTNLQYGMIIGGVIALWYLFKKRELRVQTDKEIFLPDKEVIKGGVKNAGAILFIVISIVSMIINLFT